MIETSRKLMHIIVGILLMLLGVAGIVLPILNGTLFLIVGLIIISFESPYVEKKLVTVLERSPMLYSWYHRLDVFLRKIFRKNR